METLASIWAVDPRDLNNLRAPQQEPSSAWESQCVFNSSPAAGRMWTEQLSPHLQRNKQLQDTLLQREEELVRLQEENNKLRQFLSSSFVRNLEQKVKKLAADGRRRLKRNLYPDERPFQSCVHHPLSSTQQVSKRVCRNLTAKFCSDSSDKSTSSEPNLDLWVLRTLGLKDRDTIDTSSDSSSSSGCSLSLVCDTAVTTDLDSSFSPVVTSTPSSVHFRGSTHPTNYSFTAAECQQANCSNPASPPQSHTSSPGQRSRFTAAAPAGPYEASEVAISSYTTLPAFQTPPATEESPLTQSPDQAVISPIAASWPPLRSGRTPAQDKIQFSPPGERVPFCPILSSSPPLNQQWSPAAPRTPHSRTDLAFSMSLSPSSSVKTHSFPQGQAFVRKDPKGRWNFTWVPRQGP